MAPKPGQRCVVVTGASTGIGLGTVKLLIQEGYHVFGSVRKQSDAECLLKECGEGVTPLIFDVCDAPAIKEGAAQVRKLLHGRTLFALVNNAGAAFHGPLMFQPIEDFRKNIEINLIGTLQVTQAFLPLLGADAALQGLPGRIVMVSSVGGRFAAPFIGAYAASKHGLEGMSASLRRELMLYGIDVIIIGPGAVVTPIWDKAEAQDVSMYDSSPYKEPLAAFANLMLEDGRSGHSVAHIARCLHKFSRWILRALTAKRPWTRYAIVANRLGRWTLPLLLPARWVDWLMATKLSLLPKEILAAKMTAPPGLKTE